MNKTDVTKTLVGQMQQKCSDWGIYWRAPDAHGVQPSVEQATELLVYALGVEVEIKLPEPQPVPMILHCPRCHLQHIDEPRHPGLGCRREVPQANPSVDGSGPVDLETWMNPPHRSHLCAGCGFIWRPADVPTTGVAAITTRGQNDTDFTLMPVFSDAQVERAARTPMPGGAAAWHWVFGGGMEITQDHLDWFRRVLSFGACGVLANPERDRSPAAAQERSKDLSAELQELLRQKRSEKPGEPT